MWLILYLLFLTSAAFAGDGSTLNYEKRTLPNGLRVIIVEHHELPMVAIELMVQAGSTLDPADRPGLANLTSSLLLGGTTTRTAEELSEEIEFVGGSLEEQCGYDCTTISATSLSKDLRTILGLLSEVVLSSSFPEEELARQREKLKASILSENDDRKKIAERHLNEILFGNHPYGHPPIGTLEGLSVITRSDLPEFHRRYYLPNNSVLVVVGDIVPSNLWKEVESCFNGWKAGEFTSRPFPPPGKVSRKIYFVNKPDLTQTEICIGFLGIERKDPAFFSLLLVNHILTAGPASRLYTELRAKRGLTYGVKGKFYARKKPGPFFIRTYTKNETTLETLELLFEELAKVQKEGVTQEELGLAKAYHIGSFPLALETPSQIASQLLELELYDLPEDYLLTYTKRIEEISLEEINQFAKRFINMDNMVIVLVGKAAEVLEQVKRLGEVELREL